MVKAKAFWKFLCEKLNYRFYSGVPCKGLALLYNKMDSKIMHYIPAINENIALGLVSGISISGMKGGILIHINSIYNILNYIISFNFKYKIPFLIITYCDEDIIPKDIGKILSLYKIPVVYLSDAFEKELKCIINKSEKKETPCIVVIKGGLLK